MLDTLWRKAWRDLGRHRARSALVVLAVAIALLAGGVILNAWALVRRATEEGYRASLPVSATLTVDHLDAVALAQVRAMPEIAAARLRLRASASVQSGGGWLPAQLFALENYDDGRMARLQADSGAWPPAEGQVLIERSSLEFSDASLDEALLFRLGHADPGALRLTGVLRDVSLAPGWMDHVVYGYTTAATLLRIGGSAVLQDLQFRARNAGADRQAVRLIAARVKALIERQGGHVTAVDVPEPGQHVHAAQMDSLLLTQGAFGLLALLVCAFLVVNLVTAMLAGQSREIGILKVLGASRWQIAALYLGQALLLGLTASLLALPPALVFGRQYAALKAQMLNFSVEAYATPGWAIALQCAIGCLLPVLAAAVPVRRACAASVGAALRDIGIVQSGRALATRRMPSVIGRPLLLALGNAFRRRQRMVLTLLALAAAGAVFLGAANLRAGVLGSVAQIYAGSRYDALLRMDGPQPAQALQAVAAGVDGLAAAEAWRSVHMQMAQSDGLEEDLTVVGLPPDSALFRPLVLEGRWLHAEDEDQLVVNLIWLRQHPGLRTGDALTLSLDGQRKTWHLVGTVDAGPQPLAYANRETLAGEGLANLLAVSSRTPLDTVQRLRAALASAGMPVASSHLQGEGRQAMEDHLLMVVEFLGAMAWVMMAVGGMGLASTMGMSVLERSREIGVLRALGARNRTVMGLVQTEGLVIVALAWGLSLPLSAPVGLLLGKAFGRIMFPVPVEALPSPGAALRWLAIMVLISIVACAGPALRAMRVSAARALSYE